MTAPADSDSDLDGLVADAADDFHARRARGEDPDPEAYAARHPAAADRLRRVLGMLRRVTIDPPADRPVPEVLGDFRVGREVGRGGMGVVFEAAQLSLPRRVALKVLPAAAVIDPRRVERFRAEAFAAARLEHPRVVQVFEVGRDRGFHFIAMQFIDGRPLSDVIRDRYRPGDLLDPAATTVNLGEASTPPPRPSADPPDLGASPTTPTGGRRQTFFQWAADVGRQAAEGLDHVHRVEVVHRDVKPSNLLLDRAGNVWVSDFGVAKLADTNLTADGDVFGTPQYMSPEQARGANAEVDGRADVYSLGATLYELLTGRLPVPGRTKAEVLKRIEALEPIPPRRHDRRIPRDLETIVLKCLRKRPAERYASAADLAADLGAFLADGPIKARRRSPAYRAWRAVRAHRWPVLTGLAVAVAAVGLAMIPPSPETLQDRRERQLTADLRGNKAYEVSDFKDLPPSFRWRSVVNGLATAEVGHRALLLETSGTGVYEISRDPGVDSYRVTALVRHTNAVGHSRAGLYFGYREDALADGGRAAICFSLTFADLNGPDIKNVHAGRVAVEAQIWFFGADGTRRNGSRYVIGKEFAPDLKENRPGPVRQIAVEVRPGGVRALWKPSPEAGEVVVAELTAEGLNRAAAELAKVPTETSEVRYEFSPRLGTGLFLGRGSASVPAIRLEPVD
jgi:serine/threonine protein kinase